MTALLLTAAMLAAGPDSDQAFANLETLPVADRSHYAYLTLSPQAPEQRERLTNVLRVIVPSLSASPYLGDQFPVPIDGTNLLRIDLQGLGWSQWSKVVLERYVPAYRPDLLGGKAAPLVVRADFVAAVLTDAVESGNAQELLLYGKELKTSSDFRHFWTVNGNPLLSFGRIEGASGVAIQETRLMQNLPVANRGYFWETFDSRVIAGPTDPLENLTARPPKHDASELIAAIPKHYAGKSGTLQAYFLADGKGAKQAKAPADIVEDDLRTRTGEIRNTISCIGCHFNGLRDPTLDQYREYILSGARIYADKVTQREIDRYLDSPIAKELARNQADYADGVKLCCGLTPEQFSAAFIEVVRAYDAPINLAQAARELHCTPTELRFALGDYSRRYGFSARLALLAQEKEISRAQFIANFGLAQTIIANWQAGK